MLVNILNCLSKSEKFPTVYISLSPRWNQKFTFHAFLAGMWLQLWIDTTAWDFSSKASEVKTHMLGKIHPGEARVRIIQRAEVPEAEFLVVPPGSRHGIMVSEPRSGRPGVSGRAALCYNLDIITRWVCVPVQLGPTLAAPWTVARLVPLSMGLPRQEY